MEGFFIFFLPSILVDKCLTLRVHILKQTYELHKISWFKFFNLQMYTYVETTYLKNKLPEQTQLCEGWKSHVNDIMTRNYVQSSFVLYKVQAGESWFLTCKIGPPKRHPVFLCPLTVLQVALTHFSQYILVLHCCYTNITQWLIT